MAKLEGKLHPGQYEVLRAIWEIGPPGATTLQIWELISRKRSIVRTTVLNVVDRLEKRGWLSRQKLEGDWHYWPNASREEIEAGVAEEFVNCFFEGSASDLMLSLIGQQKVTPEEMARLKEALFQAKAGTTPSKRQNKKQPGRKLR